MTSKRRGCVIIRMATASALAILDAPFHIPVTGEVLGRGKAHLFGRLPVITAAEVCRALPESAVLTLVNVKGAIHQNMALNGHSENSKVCKTCVSLFRSLDLTQTIGFAWFLA